MAHELDPDAMLRHMTGGGATELRPAIIVSSAERAYRQLDTAAHQRTLAPHDPLEMIEIFDEEAGADDHRFYFMQNRQRETIAHLPQRDGSILTLSADFGRKPSEYNIRELANLVVMRVALEERLERLDGKVTWVKVHPNWYKNKH